MALSWLIAPIALVDIPLRPPKPKPPVLDEGIYVLTKSLEEVIILLSVKTSLAKSI